MRWYHLVSYFVGSSAVVNVLWGLFNLAVGYLLVVRVGRFDLRRTAHVLTLGGGVALAAVWLARHFAKFHGGNI